MLLESSELMVRSGQEEDFAEMMRKRGLAIVGNFPGVGSVRFGRGLENPDKFILLVEWDGMDAHTAFTKSDVYPPFRALLAPFLEGGPMEHFQVD